MSELDDKCQACQPVECQDCARRQIRPASNSPPFGFAHDDLLERARRRSETRLAPQQHGRAQPGAEPDKPQSPLNKAMDDENVAIHKEIAALSTRGGQRVVAGAGHVIQADHPRAVIDAVLEVLNGAKSRIRKRTSTTAPK